jgi:hypothetical protein
LVKEGANRLNERKTIDTIDTNIHSMFTVRMSNMSFNNRQILETCIEACQDWDAAKLTQLVIVVETPGIDLSSLFLFGERHVLPRPDVREFCKLACFEASAPHQASAQDSVCKQAK